MLRWTDFHIHLATWLVSRHREIIHDIGPFCVNATVLKGAHAIPQYRKCGKQVRT